MKESKLKIYLAGPEVFSEDAENTFQQMKNVCDRNGVIGVSPYDANKTSKSQSPFEIFNTNISLIHYCDAVVADMQAFRGPSMDVGTAYEMGYADALGKIIVGYTRDDTRTYFEKVQYYLECLQDGGHAECLRQWQDMEIENFGLVDNLMVASSHPICVTFEDAVRKVIEISQNISSYFYVDSHG